MTPKVDDLLKASGKFETKSRADFAQWLLGIVEEAHRQHDAVSQSAPPSPFEPFIQLLAFHHLMPDVLERVYNKYIPEDKKLLFREAVGDAIDTYAKDMTANGKKFRELNYPQLRDFIYLIEKIEAKEALSSLEKATASLSDPAEFHYDCVAVISSVEPSPELEKLARTYVGHKNFPEKLLIQVVGLLMQCVPEKSLELAREFLPRMTSMRSKSIQSDKERNDFDENLGYILSELPTAARERLKAHKTYPAEQSWFFDALPAEAPVPADSRPKAKSDPPSPR